MPKTKHKPIAAPVLNYEDKKLAAKEVLNSLFETYLYIYWGKNGKTAEDSIPDVLMKKALRIAVLDATLVHLRALDTFFSTSNKKDSDDMRATDFGFALPERRILRKATRDSINSQIAHLNWSRPKGEKSFRVIEGCIRALECSVGFFEHLLATFFMKSDAAYASYEATVLKLKKLHADFVKENPPSADDGE